MCPFQSVIRIGRQTLGKLAHAEALGHAPVLAEAYVKIKDPEELRALDDRARDFWEILWLLADLARQEGSPEVLETFARAVADASAERQAGEQDTSLAAFLEALVNICQGDEDILTPKDLLGKLKDQLGEEAPRTSVALASRLKRLEIPRARKRVDGKPSRTIILRREQLEALLEKYAPAGEKKT